MTEYKEFLTIKGNFKSDIQSDNKLIKCQVKKYKKGQFQQLDRGWVDDMIKTIPELKESSSILKDLCEYPLLEDGRSIDKTKNIKKLCKSNYDELTLSNFITELNKHKRSILNYAFLGSNKEYRPDYLFGIEYINNIRTKIVLFTIIDIINYLESLDFKISIKKTVIKLGDDGILSLQRKGGDDGKKTSNHLQFKIILSKLIDKVKNVNYCL